MTRTEVIRETLVHVAEDFRGGFGHIRLRLLLALFDSLFEGILIVDECRFLVVKNFLFDFALVGLLNVVLVDIGVIADELVHRRQDVFCDVHELLLLPDAQYPIEFLHDLLSEEVV